MTRPGTLFILLSLLAGSTWLLLLGLPGRRDQHGEFGLPGLLRARSAASFLRARSPSSGDPDLLAQAVRASGRLEEGLVQLSFDYPSAGYLARSSARLLRPALAVPKRIPLEPSEPLALWPVKSLGQRGHELLRLSKQNLELWPESAQRTLAGLVEAQNGISRLLWQQIQSRGGPSAQLRAADRLLDQLQRGSLPPDPADPELVAVLAGFDREAVLELLIDLADRVDELVSMLQRELTAKVLRSMETLPEGSGIPRDLLVLAQTEAGLVIVGGVHTTILPQNGVALTIDLGGDDRWAGGVSISGATFPEPLTRVCVDMHGNDRYQGRGGQLGGCAQGLSVLVDLEGDDTYESDGLEFGAALFGAALLIDRGASPGWDSAWVDWESCSSAPKMTASRPSLQPWAPGPQTVRECWWTTGGTTSIWH